MMDWSDRHCRFFHRLMTKRALLYTEMIVAQAIIHGDRTRLLGFDPREQSVALQIGGSDPALLAEAARWGEHFGYREINLNVGCPSDRVQDGRFGACLMAEPQLVAASVAAMRRAVSLPVTVKCRIGIDDQDGDESLDQFIDAVASAGCDTIIVHARKAWLQGLSPKENREIPPLDYARVYRLKAARPGLTIIINGGIASLAAVKDHLEHVDGVMLGRAAYQTPWILASADRELFGDRGADHTRLEICEALMDYAGDAVRRGIPLARITRHILGLFHGEPGGRLWRRILSETSHRPGAGPEMIARALSAVEPAGRVMAAAGQDGLLAIGA
ncbi:tRNA dihydrouridine(20/20a) synthase DusA [soil metagenome]